MFGVGSVSGVRVVDPELIWAVAVCGHGVSDRRAVARQLAGSVSDNRITVRIGDFDKEHIHARAVGDLVIRANHQIRDIRRLAIGDNVHGSALAA
ncbi:hypothetical protein, partial [Escherichia coli]|uniref:hypothetical protein n=1 Tax=Escherichia coli TaxID=562 RepID=UPI00113219CD